MPPAADSAAGESASTPKPRVVEPTAAGDG